jgi:hypothetical protein
MTSRFWSRLWTNVAGYVLCVLASMYVAEPAAAKIAKMTYWVLSLFRRVDSSGIAGFYTSNWFLFSLIAGVACGCAIYSVWRHTIATLVWVPSACVLCQKILTRPHSVLDMPKTGSDVLYYLSLGCTDLSVQSFYISQRCADQFLYSLPFYAALGFSTGAFLSMIYWKRKKRLIKVICLLPSS